MSRFHFRASFLIGFLVALPLQSFDEKPVSFSPELLQSTAQRLLETKTAQIEELPLSKVCARLTKVLKVPIQSQGCEGKFKVAVKAGPIGEVFNDALASQGYTWGIQPDGNVQVIPLLGEAATVDPTKLPSTPNRLEQTVNMKFVGRKLSEVLRFQQAVSGTTFVFREKDVQGAKLDLEGMGVPLGTLLHEGLSRRGFRFFVRPDGKIAVIPWPPSGDGLKNTKGDG